MQRQDLEITEIAETCAEIVKRDANATLGQAVETAGRAVEIGDKRLLGNFKGQAPCRETRIGQHRQQILAKGAIEQVHGGDIERKAQV